MSLPRLIQPDTAPSDCVALVVYAPFGTDETLSTYPDGSSVELVQHPLVQSLLKVAAHGVHVSALIDRVHEDTWLLDIPAHGPGRMKLESRWKQDMTDPGTLAGLLQHAHLQHPGAAIVLALEGHGAGFLPDLDWRLFTAANLTENGTQEWHIQASSSTVSDAPGAPILPGTAPLLPGTAPLLPVNHMPMSTWGLGEALRRAVERGVPRPSVLQFSNCFNMSAELLHTVAPHAAVASGVMNYDFFTAGASYPGVFHKLAQQGSAAPLQLARWFCEGQRDYLAAKGHHPTCGGVVELSRMHEIAERLDDLADALLAALRTASPADRPATVQKIQDAIVRAQQFDTDGNFLLDTPDELTDLCSFAHELQKADFSPYQVGPAAAALQKALAGIKEYGDSGTPWVAPGRLWDFGEKTLAMNILLPDPLRKGLWDWRSPYYLDVNPDPSKPKVQPNIIELLKVTDWVDFIVEYHRDVAFAGLLPALIPEFPVFNAHYKPQRDGGGRGGSGGSCAGDRAR